MLAARLSEVTPSGFDQIGPIPWGAHLCHLHRGADDLVSLLVPYFAAGLQNNERCVWVACPPLPAQKAEEALRAALPEVEAFLRSGQLIVVDHAAWFSSPIEVTMDEHLRRLRLLEEEALRLGYRGLRLSGAVPVDEQGAGHANFEQFQLYEARLHRAFQGRRIVALCSYAYESCSNTELLEVTRHHGGCIVLDRGRPRIVHSAAAVVAALRPREQPHFRGAQPGHEVVFHADGSIDAPRIARFLAEGLQAGEGVIAIVSGAHRPLLEDALADLGIHAAARRDLVFLDARATLELLLVDGAPQSDAFADHVAAPIAKMREQHVAVRAYGEMVDLLAADGNHEAVSDLEGLWNALMADAPMRLLCGYAWERFDSDPDRFRGVCAAHVDVHAAAHVEKKPKLLAVELEHTERVLAREAKRRRSLEHEREQLSVAERNARAQAAQVREHIALLQRATAALSEALSQADIARVVVTHVAQTINAIEAVASVPTPDGASLLVLDETGLVAVPRAPSDVVSIDGDAPIARAFKTGAQVWLGTRAEVVASLPLEASSRSHSILALPLVVGSRRLGAVGFGFDAGQRLTDAELVLAEDLARQTALALDRARYYEEARESRDRLLTLSEIAARLSAARLDLEQVLETVVREVMERCAEVTTIALADDETGALRVAASASRLSAPSAGMREALMPSTIERGRGVLGIVAETGVPVLVSGGEQTSDPRTLCVVPLRASGRVVGVLGTGRQVSTVPFTTNDRDLLQDIADRAGLAIENARLYVAARAANRRKDNFIAMLGHELRNPLAPIVTALDLMRLKGDATTARERSVIERHAEHLTGLVDDLLDVSRIEQGKLALARTTTSIASILACAVEKARPLIERRGHALACDLPPDDLVVDADAARLAQAVANLLSNAARYTDANGHIALRCVVHGGEIAIVVEDDGLGLAPEMLPLVFTPFLSLGLHGDALDRSPGGLGLGLALVKSIVELHGGRVSAASQGLGKGTTMTIVVPASSGAPTPKPAQPQRLAAQARRVLIIDDNPDAADALAELVAVMGHEPAVAYDATGALELAAKFRFEDAVLDLGMPKMDGYELRRRLAELAGERRVRFFALTGFGTDDDRHRTAAAGFAAHFVKPVGYDDLAQRLADPLPTR